MLVTINDVLSEQELAHIRQQLKQAPWASGQLTAGSQAAGVKNNQQVPEDAPALAGLRQRVLAALHRCPLFFTAALPLKILPPYFNRHSGQTNAYGAHIDCAMRRQIDASAGYVRSDVSATLFISDPEDYDGGSLSIDDTFGSHSLKLPAGSLVIYPSSCVHAVTPVTRGERLACFMFIQSMVRDAGQRRLLYDMDMALLTLRAELGETPALVQLTGTYHNLLRRWAQS